jgi:hypothetical protein
MPRVKKLTRHLRKIAQNRNPLTHTRNQELQDENFIYKPVEDGHEMLIFDKEEWDAILAEPDSDGLAEDETEGEDWEETKRTLESGGEVWSELYSTMQSAAAGLKPIKPRNGTTRQNLHHRNMVLKKAAEGTSPLSSFGFTIIRTGTLASKKSRATQPIGKITGYCLLKLYYMLPGFLGIF